MLAAVGEVGVEAGGAEGSVVEGDAAVRRGDALPGARGGLDDEAGLVTIFGCGRAADDLEGLHGVGGKLVGEDLALLVGDGLAIDREGVLGVVAEAVEEA